MSPVPDNDEALLLRMPGAHCDELDVMETPRVRSVPRHRARRAVWKPPLETTHPQHAYDRDALLR